MIPNLPTICRHVKRKRKKRKKVFYCTPVLVENISRTAAIIGVSESDICVVALEIFLQKELSDQLQDFSHYWQKRAETAKNRGK